MPAMWWKTLGGTLLEIPNWYCLKQLLLTSTFSGGFVLIEALKRTEIYEVADGNIGSILLHHYDDAMKSARRRRVLMALQS
eukprot:6083443-Karenia_brevis.AAC.1